MEVSAAVSFKTGAYLSWPAKMHPSNVSRGITYRKKISAVCDFRLVS